MVISLPIEPAMLAVITRTKRGHRINKPITIQSLKEILMLSMTLSRVFIQWIDCVWQLTNQFPLAFEFNEYPIKCVVGRTGGTYWSTSTLYRNYLVTLLENTFSCKFGNFLFDSEKMRVRAALAERTVSIWSEIEEHKDKYTNIYYTPTGTFVGSVSRIRFL